MSRVKRFVDTNVYCRADGKRIPVMVRVDGRDYTISNVKSVRSVGRSENGEVLQYAVKIKGKETYIYESNGRWFVRIKQEDDEDWDGTFQRRN